MQTVLPGSGRVGDCLRACIASLLEQPCEAVPHYMNFDDWRERLSGWLEEERGLALLEFDLTKPLDGVYPVTERTYVIVAGATRRHPDRLHAVVARTYGGGLRWQYVHDPHPSADFLLREERLYMLVCTDPKERR